MAKKRNNRRQERRRHHQATQALRRREEKREVEAAVENVNVEFAALASAAEDEEVTPSSFADQVVKLLADDLCGRMMADPDFGGNRGADAGWLAGEERGRALVVALSERIDGEPRLLWFTASLAESCGDLETAERILLGAVTSLDAEEAGAAISNLGGLWLQAGRLGDALEILDSGCARLPENEDLQALRARCLARASAVVRIADGDADDSTRTMADALGLTDLGPAEVEMARAAVDQFADRATIYELREAVDAFVASEPGLLAWRDASIAEFISDARESGELGAFDDLGGDGLLRL